ncbi:DegT/DnrJ/EryC1/StrS family aminotransferase [Eggerthellaceae bacterium zg-1084]|uniref:DegT/DnrJ/EryC1/StrS family aminotransferase n=1 Tax=Berryella wangjianweii TaxID=2734634 RepID=UPI001553ACD4|nr:aminotransferase class I/II-fold pyridoxal phosphate-dependent enzyme [Berryella wangjianweii]NPD31131.1 DegT/DnrJ/EryC1/StrS family aminotransferase [Berryella wangjianweii]
MTQQRTIAFSPPDITQAEVDAVTEALRSGWITTGPRTKRFEERLAAFMGTPRVAALNSATAALACALRALGVGPGDEVITSAYTYTASASCICHVGARPVLCDVAPGSFEMDPELLASLVGPRTRAVIPVDLGGVMIDYDTLDAALRTAQKRWRPTSERQEHLGRVPIVADAAHSLGAARHGRASGTVADLSAVSFHAVKNLTTAEGGALTWRAGAFDDEALYRDLMLMSLHGQTKDALAKTKAGAWEYDIAFPGWKCNMNELSAALGLTQLDRYPQLLARRRALVARYEQRLTGSRVQLLGHYALDDREAHTPGLLSDDQAAQLRAREAAAPRGHASSGHLLIARVEGLDVEGRNRLIESLAAAGVAANVHYKPLPLLSAYRNLGYRPADFPHALAMFQNEVTLPLHTLLSDDDVDYVCDTLLDLLGSAQG